jgi:Skp family chaperone for outer membrane proteins
MTSNGSSIQSVPASQASQGVPQFPNGKTLLEGYRTDIMSNFEGETPRFNPLNSTRPNSSMLLNVNDPIQIHLLVETALGDAKEYELLSPEEVDDLKKQCQSLTQRIRQTRQSLAVQSKYRDAAINMAKLYSPTGKDGEAKKHRLSLSLNRNSHSEQVREADMERVTSERRCEELAQELWGLERRLIEPQTRLLKHTAGILQMTHKGPAKGHKPNMPSQQGIPGSPESMFTYSNARSSIDHLHEEDLFDDRSLYLTFDRLDGLGFGGHDSVDGHTRRPSGSPNRSKDLGEDALKFKEEATRSKEQIASTEAKLEHLNNRLREVIIRANPQRDETYNRPPQILPAETSAQPGALLGSHLDYLEQGINAIDEEQSLSSTKQEMADLAMEETIGELNREVQAILSPFNPSLPAPPEFTGQSLKEQLSYLKSSINTVESELQRAASASSELEAELQRAASNRDKDASQSGDLSNMQNVLEGLWDIIQSGEQDDRRRRQQRRQTRIENGEEPEDDDTIDIAPEPFSLQAFSTKVQWLYGQATLLKDQKEVLQRQIKQQRELNNKSDETKDREMAEMEADLQTAQAALENAESQAQDLQGQLMAVMQQLDKSRRESSLRSQEDAKKEDEAAQLTEALVQRSELVERLRDEVQELKMGRGVDEAEMQARLAESETRVEELGKALEKAEGRIGELVKELEGAEKEARVLREKEALLEASTMALREKGVEVEASTVALREKEAQLEASTIALREKEVERERVSKLLEGKEVEVESVSKLLKGKEQEMERMSKLLEGKEQEMDDKTMEIARLQTEVTIARAELDGAYGSRAQRAAEVAANPAIQREIDGLLQSNVALKSEIETLRRGDGKVEELKRELSETIEEYEVMTKASIEWERERESLEKEIDRLRDEREGLEAKLSDERVRWLGMRSPGPDGVGGQGAVGAGNTSTAVLKNEFKKMMRDTRAENAKALRVCIPSVG